MSTFSDYLKKSLEKEKEELKQKTQKAKKTVFESSLDGYIKKYKNIMNEEDAATSDNDEYLPSDSKNDAEEKDDTGEDNASANMNSEDDNSDDYEKDEDDEAQEGSAPIATRDESVNVENRQKAIDEFGYGPEKIDEPNDDFWNEKKEKFMVPTVDLAKQSLCGTCAAFNIKSEMLKYLDDGIDKEIDENDTWDANKENRGYCQFIDFKCHKTRTCNSWVEGGPLKDKTETTALATTNTTTTDTATPPAE